MSKEEKKTEGMDTESDTNPRKRQKTQDTKDIKQAENKSKFQRYVDQKGFKHIALKLNPGSTMMLVYIGSGWSTPITNRAKFADAFGDAMRPFLDEEPEYIGVSFRLSDLGGILATYLLKAQTNADFPWPEKQKEWKRQQQRSEMVDEWALQMNYRMQLYNDPYLIDPISVDDIRRLLWLMREFDQEYIKARPPKVHGFIMPGEFRDTDATAAQLVIKVLDQTPLAPEDISNYVLTPIRTEEAVEWWTYARDSNGKAMWHSRDFGIWAPKHSIYKFLVSDKAKTMKDTERRDLCSANVEFLSTFRAELKSLNPNNAFAKEKMISNIEACLPDDDAVASMIRRCMYQKPPIAEDVLLVQDAERLGSENSDHNILPYVFARMVQRVPSWRPRSWLYRSNVRVVLSRTTQEEERVDHHYPGEHPKLENFGLNWSFDNIKSLFERHPAVRAYLLQQTGWSEQEGLYPIRNRLVNPESEDAYKALLRKREFESQKQGTKMDVNEQRSERVKLPTNVVRHVFSFLARYDDNPMMSHFVAFKYGSEQV